MKRNCCLNCLERYPLCHSTCESYKKYRNRLDTIKKNKLEASQHFAPIKKRR